MLRVIIGTLVGLFLGVFLSGLIFKPILCDFKCYYSETDVVIGIVLSVGIAFIGGYIGSKLRRHHSS